VVLNVSILTPLRLNILGRRVGDSIGRQMFIEKMIYQPEAYNQFNF